MRLAVVSPSVDRRRGTERAIAELVERLAVTYHCEVHLFAQSVADLQVSPAESPGAANPWTGSIHWHRVAALPGPHLFRFAAWFLLNRLQRSHGDFDLVLSPGINCSDADVVIVHALFCQLANLAETKASGQVAFPRGLRRLHRRAYYSLLNRLERLTYADRRVALVAVSRRTASLLEHHFHRQDVSVVANGVDAEFFSPAARIARRGPSRLKHDLRDDHFVLLLIGNDCATKGIHAILAAMALLSSLPLRLLVVGNDVREPFVAAASKLGVSDRCIWHSVDPGVLDFYAAADVYVSPSREDSFGLPVLEAMACGLPAITSVAAGVSELVNHGVDGFVMPDPEDAQQLAQLIARLYQDSSLRCAVGKEAARTATRWTWDRCAAAVWPLLEKAAAAKSASRRQPLKR